MSRYIILIDYKKKSPYSSEEGLPYLALFMEGSSKYANKRPYFGSNLDKLNMQRYSYTLEKLPEALKRAQLQKDSNNKKYVKSKAEIFVLKTNSTKLVKRPNSSQYTILQ